MEMEAGEKGETWIQVGSLFAPKLSHQQITTALPNFVTLAAGAAEQDNRVIPTQIVKRKYFQRDN